jgi:hypothetical protein
MAIGGTIGSLTREADKSDVVVARETSTDYLVAREDYIVPDGTGHRVEGTRCGKPQQAEKLRGGTSSKLGVMVRSTRP